MDWDPHGQRIFHTLTTSNDGTNRRFTDRDLGLDGKRSWVRGSDEEQIVGRMMDTTIDDQALSLRLRHLSSRHCLSQRLFSLVSDFCHFCSSGHGSRRQCPRFRRWTAGLCLFPLVFPVLTHCIGAGTAGGWDEASEPAV